MASGDQRPLHQRPIPQVEGFRFECQPGCSACCDMEGEVYLTQQDLERIAEHLGMQAADFEQKYVSRTARSMRLRKPPDRQCLFHRDNRCSIHPVKPVQCRAFPFWPEIIESETAWNETAQRCPGMNKGELVQIEAARKSADEMLRAYPQMYPGREAAASQPENPAE